MKVSSSTSLSPCLGCRGAEVIKQQIQVNEQNRLLEAERKDQETQAMLQYLEKLQEEDMTALQRKRETQHKLMEEVAQCNEEIQGLKLRQREQEKLEDLKVMEYLKEKEVCVCVCVCIV